MDTRVMVVGSAKTKSFQRRRPRIRLAGFWLNEFGFEPDSIVSAEFTKGRITLTMQGKGADVYSRIVQRIRKTNSGLFQVTRELHNKKETPHLELKGFWLEELGFYVGSILAVQSEQGVITVRLLELDKLGIENKRATK